MKAARWFCVLLSLVLLAGCTIENFARSYYDLKWELLVTKIERSSEAEGKRGALRDIGITEFEDDVLRIDAQATHPMEAFFVLTNRTQYDLRIDWRRAKFVDIYGKTHPVTITQASSTRLDNPVEGHITEIKPAQLVKLRITPPDRPFIEKLRPWELQGITGKTFEVSFLLQVEGKSYEYVSTFKITNWDGRRKPADPL